VVARTSCFAFKDKHEDIREIGRKLNVDHVLEGSIRKAGNRVRITGQLIEISDGFHLWSEKFDRNLEDIFEIQDEISHKIAEKLRLELLETSDEPLVKRPTDDLEAYNLYLKGRHFWGNRLESDLLRSVSYFEQAVELDPEFALGYAGLADAHLILADHGYSGRRDHLKRAEKYARMAIEIDDTLAEPHATLGSVKFNQWKWSEAEEVFKRAIELNPHYPTAHQWYGLYLIGMRRLDEAREHLSLARELDPISTALILAQALYFHISRQYDKAIEVCREGMELSPNGGFPMIAGWSLIEKGEYQGAIEKLNRASELYTDEPYENEPSQDIAVFVGRTLAKMGKIEEARRILDDCLREAENGRVQPTAVAVLYLSLGDTDSGIKWLERSIDEKDSFFPIFGLSPVLDGIRDNPRFISLLSRAGLANRPGGESNE
jgi:tetratricopeptide (TPR) repeat protein